MHEVVTRPGVLVLAPGGEEEIWTVVEVDSDVFATLRIPERNEELVDAERYDTASSALRAAHDVLTLATEGRLPMMHEHVQESVREFVRLLEDNGYDRESALQALMDLVDRKKSTPPSAESPTSSPKTSPWN